MNWLHQWLCASTLWAGYASRNLVPWVLEAGSLGGTVLEIGPGYGATTRLLADRVSDVTVIENDVDLANQLRPSAPGVRVVHGDGAAMPFPDGSYSGVVCFTMLHHVLSAQLQDQLFAEAYRVLQPGGVFAGTDSRATLAVRLVHVFDTLVPVDPDTLPGRLDRAGFERIRIDKRRGCFRFRAHKPPERDA